MVKVELSETEVVTIEKRYYTITTSEEMPSGETKFRNNTKICIEFKNGKFHKVEYNFKCPYDREDWKSLSLINNRITYLEELKAVDPESVLEDNTNEILELQGEIGFYKDVIDSNKRSIFKILNLLNSVELNSIDKNYLDLISKSIDIIHTLYSEEDVGGTLAKTLEKS